MKKFSLLMMGLLLMIIAGAQTTLPVNITYVMNKTNPPSYSFATDFKGEAVKYAWYFGDESTSDQVTPTYTFKYTKNYVVQVKILDKSGATNYGKIEARFEGASVVTTACKASFTATVVPNSSGSVTGSKTVKFKSQSIGAVKEYQWLFGDETKSTDPEPSHVYANYGEYKVCLIITTTEGCKSDFCTGVRIPDPNQAVTLYAKGIVKDLSANSGCKWGIAVENTTVLLPAEMAVPFEFKAGQNVEIAYQLLANTTTVCQAGKPAKILKISEVQVAPVCKTSFTFQVVPSGTADVISKKVEFKNVSSGTIRECVWYFGDETKSTELNPTHEYASYGEYKVCLTIVTTDGCKSDFCTGVRVGTVPPVTTCGFDLVTKPKEQTPKAYLFYAISKYEIKTWKWNFGDGGASEAQNPEHTYEKAGTYEVSCIITTLTGCTVTRTVKLVVQAPALPVCPGAISLTLYDPTSKTVCDGKAVVSLLDPTARPYSSVKYAWSTGATGEKAENLCVNKQYVVTATIESVCQKSTSFSFLSAPVINVSNTGSKYGFTVDSPSTDIIYKWEFGDGNVAYGSAVDYEFGKEGNFDVTLTAISGNYSAATIQKVAVIDGLTPLKELSVDDLKIFPNPVRDRLMINFTKPVTGQVNIEVTDMKGARVLIQGMTLSGQKSIEIPVGNLNNGIFFLRVNNQGNVLTGMKFLKSN